MTITLDELKAFKEKKALKHKFGAIKCQREGIKFPSKLERTFYDFLTSLKKQESILFFLRQIPFDLPGNSKHYVDFLVFNKENVIFIEAKGRDLALGKMKRQQVEELYGINIFVASNVSELNQIVLKSKQDEPFHHGKTLC